ncbi:hypothetical protein [Paracoccus homiensis]|uniref:Uncharacterized protein n=1 Tax=Paracoccus homiensis TaxID=364199 RepID=A0A1I0J083_9RHOB|nr:hypothetical protein [Paracoccus homiensis]SEU02393.1 hypothetical protein SAMN04489858_12012 [Paracoccus homiensis]
MTTIFDGTPTYPGISGDRARVTSVEGRVLVRAIDMQAEEAVTIALTPMQAAELAGAIIACAAKAKEYPNA